MSQDTPTSSNKNLYKMSLWKNESTIDNQTLHYTRIASTKWLNPSPFFGQNPARHRMMVYACVWVDFFPTSPQTIGVLPPVSSLLHLCTSVGWPTTTSWQQNPVAEWEAVWFNNFAEVSVSSQKNRCKIIGFLRVVIPLIFSDVP